MIETILMAALSGLLGVLAGILFKASAVEGLRNDMDNRLKAVWWSVKRIGDDCDTMRARIHDLERKLEEGKDDGK